jgi:3-keto-5-aminohexanoate cleavage enzyme
VGKLVIEAAINEQSPKAANPHVPYTPEEVVADALACFEAGASIVHFHARHAETGALQIPGTHLYAEAMREIRRVRPDALVYPTYGSGTPVERFAHVDALAADPAVRCDLATIDPGTVNMGRYDGAGGVDADFVFSVVHADCRHFFDLCARRRVRPTVVIREPGAVRTAVAYHRMGWLPAPLFLRINLTDDAPWGLPPSMRSVDAYLGAVPPDVPCEWMAYTYGPSHWAMNLHAIAAGGHVRTGLGDNPVEPDGTTMTNADKVARVVRIAELAGRPVASCADTRALLGMPVPAPAPV